MTRANLWTPGTEPAEGAPATALYLPGASGNYISCPATAGNSITGDIDLRVKVTPNAWPPATEQILISNMGTSGNYGWMIKLATNGRIYMKHSTDGTATVEAYATHAITEGTWWLRGTLDVDNGAAGKTWTFYKSEDGSSWTRIGTTTYSGITSIYDTTAAIEVGAYGGGALSLFAGLVHTAEVRNGIDGPIVAQWDGSVPHERQVDPQGNVWTVNGTANAWQEV